ncbi:hypothetical protein ASD54_12580 [Rhizobium sp. Root149]|uniref:hypothetical protein n=1 Tax=Rhizobium sp. Root149 TaxID=1736473 RepID=UPI000714B1ED|nr:hypothetical protein [Rhizobium sp. Root149]KQZ49766.1 hypothetical protein ASD54_12580 [Rhizobium sp. Root149]
MSDIVERLSNPVSMSMFTSKDDMISFLLNERSEAADTITSLRSQLEEARDNALEEAAKVAERAAQENMGHPRWQNKFKATAAAIRKLKGAAKPKPVPSLGKLFDDLATKQRLIGEEFEKFMADVEDTTEADDEVAIRKLKEGR